MKRYLEIFLVFFKIGAFSFGGGYAMIPIIEREACESKKMGKKKKSSMTSSP